MSVKNDVSYVKELCNCYGNDEKRIYFSTNEKLQELFSKVNFDGNDVLSVLSSSDQVFLSRSANAKSVDYFDKNYITLYYYYLRLWAIKYDKIYYPYELLCDDNVWLKELLNKVNTSSRLEKRALSFWKKMSKYYAISELFNMGKDFIDVSKVDFEKAIVDNGCFYNVDFFKPVFIDKKYDIIVASNILEWVSDKYDFIMVRDNAYRLLNDNGIILCSDLWNKDNKMYEHLILGTKFDYQNLEDDLGYVYKKQ